jgi:demethylmenaquinone methyltransferase / 2-methoxy-6-polyprenyl-1,4-benzoquinol methylase
VTADPIWNDDLLKAPHEVADKAARVRTMFNAIAPRYEHTNTICSGGRDTYWRRRAVQLAAITTTDDVLDIACGTGDFTRSMASARPRSITGCDFAHDMLVRAVNVRSGTHRWVEADALQLPFPDCTFSVTCCAFGLRNFVHLDAGLAEMNRVLRPGGRVVILEFGRPTSFFVRAFYEFYSNRIMPWAASLISGDQSGAYRYLPRSVVSFLGVQQMCERLKEQGFETISATPLTFGVVNVYHAWKATAR